MGLSRLSKVCQACPYVDSCDHKQMEALGYLPEQNLAKATVDLTAPLTQPVLRETVEIHAYGQTFTVYKDDLEKDLYNALYKDLYCGLSQC